MSYPTYNVEAKPIPEESTHIVDRAFQTLETMNKAVAQAEDMKISFISFISEMSLHDFRIFLERIS